MAPTTLERTGNINYVEDTIRFPEGMQFVFDASNDPQALFERNALALYPYILRSQISYGRAAEILGVSRWSLIEWYGSQGFVCMQIDEESLQSDMDTLRELGLTRE